MGQLRDSLDDRRVLPILAVAFNLDLVVWTSSRLASISKALRKQSQFVRKYDNPQSGVQRFPQSTIWKPLMTTISNTALLLQEQDDLIA